MCIKGRRSKLDIQNTQFYFRKLNKTVFINDVDFKKSIRMPTNGTEQGHKNMYDRASAFTY